MLIQYDLAKPGRLTPAELARREAAAAKGFSPACAKPYAEKLHANVDAAAERAKASGALAPVETLPETARLLDLEFDRCVAKFGVVGFNFFELEDGRELRAPEYLSETIASLRAQLAKVKPGDTVTLKVDRGAEHLSIRVETISDPQAPKHVIIGFAPAQAAVIKLPVKVQIDAGNVGGPSAGLAFALEVLEKLGRRVDRGYKVAATGEIELNGAVGPIGGIKQKTFGARAAKADVFIVPVENAAVARRYAHGLRIIAVKSFPQALRALATLPLKH